MERGGRSREERQAAAEARARAREGGDPGAPENEPGEPRGEVEEGWDRPELDDMSRHYAGPDVYGQRRLVAGLVIVGIILILFLLLGGC